MSLPNSPISKAIKNPSDALTWMHNRILEQRIVTPLKSRYLFDHEWDLVVILDACRYDLAATRGASHPIGLGSPERAYSVASNSALWVSRTFGAADPHQLASTAYITGNVFTDRLPEAPLAYLDPVWEYAWDDDRGCIPPRPLTDRAITAGRAGRAEKYIVHYMQPHLPPLFEPEYEVKRSAPVEGEGAVGEKSVWDRVKEGSIEEDAVKHAYQNNLDPVLDEVSILLDNFDAAKTIITADHGNYLGEGGRWGHPDYEWRSPVRHVPWWETTATDRRTHQPDEYETTAGSVSREEKLEALGYR